MVTKPEEQLLSGASRFLWVDPVPRFRVSPEFCVRGLQAGLARFSMDRSRVGFRRPANGGCRASGARAEEGIMTVETRDTEFRRPERARPPRNPFHGRGRAAKGRSFGFLTDIQILRTFGGYFAQDGTSFLCRQAKIYVTQLQH